VISVSVAINNGVINALDAPWATLPPKKTSSDEPVAQINEAKAYRETAILIVLALPHFSPSVPETNKSAAKGKKKAPIPHAIVVVLVSKASLNSGIIGDKTVAPKGPRIPHM
jgi:hypothetical protein